MTRFAPALLAFALASCAQSSDARRSGQVRYEGRALAEWWQLRRDPDGAVEHEAQTAFRMLGPAAVPFLAEKAAGRDMGDVIGGSVALETLCPGALPAMEAARADYPSAALDAAIRRVKAAAAAGATRGYCTTNGDPVRPDATREAGRETGRETR